MWSDKRLDDRFGGLDRTLDRIDRDIRDLRMLMFQLWGATMLGIFATIGTVIATNA